MEEMREEIFLSDRNILITGIRDKNITIMEITLDYFREKIFSFRMIIGVKSPSARPKWSFADWTLIHRARVCLFLIDCSRRLARALAPNFKADRSRATPRAIVFWKNVSIGLENQRLFPTSFRYNAYFSLSRIWKRRVWVKTIRIYRLISPRWILTSVNNFTSVQFSGRRE